ncbi:MAG: glycosyltransferase family 4 protein [Elusimicrobiota bacterium]
MAEKINPVTNLINNSQKTETNAAVGVKVAYIITLLELGGAQEVVLYTCEHLNKNKFDVILICGKGGKLDNKTKDIKTFFVKELVRQINPINDLLAFVKIYKILKKEKPDIVHTHSSKAGIVGRWATYFLRLTTYDLRFMKIVHTIHGFGFNDEQNYFVRKIYIFVEWLAAKITNKFIAVSYENISKGLKNKIGFEKQYTVVRAGIKISDYQIKIDIDKKKKEFGIKNESVVGMVACFKKQKAPLDFIKTAKLVCNEKPDTKFILVGDGVLRGKIEFEIKKLNLEKNVILAGWRNDVNEIIKIFDIFILTSLWEGLPMVIIEAMATGIPVVATYVDGTKEVVQEGLTGFVVQPHETEKMAERILRLLNDVNLRKKFSETAKKRVQEFDADLMVLDQERLYLSLLY